MTNQTITPLTRIVSMVIDHISMTFIIMIFLIPDVYSNITNALESKEAVSFNPVLLLGDLSYLGMAALGLYFFKDIFNGKSIAKRILNLQVVDNKTGKVASPLKCITRNIFCLIWPIETIMSLVNPKRRIGDYVAGTRIIHVDKSIEV
ncbi:MAG: RDD family protein [Saprospiraceae bacterium]